MPFDNPQTQQDSKIVQHLKESKARLVQGWLKSKSYRKTGGHHYYCAVGAIMFDDHGNGVDANSRTFTTARNRLTKAVNLLADRSHICVEDFNDSYWRTKQDMELVFDIAIELQERKEQGRK